MLSIEEIKNVSFRKAGIGGYKPEDVDAFIDQVLITMEQLRKEKSDLIKKMDILATRVEEYRADEDSVRNAMLSAQRVADTTIKEARAKAAKILEESENVAKAKLYDLNVQIKKQKKQYTLLLAECTRLREEIINHCNKHIALLNKELPSDDRIAALQASVDERFPTTNNDEYERAVEVGVPASADPSSSVPSGKPAADFDSDIPAATPATSDATAPANFDDYDVSIVSDIASDDDAPATPATGKGPKSFDSLRFGDDYDVYSDTDSSDNT